MYKSIYIYLFSKIKLKKKKMEDWCDLGKEGGHNFFTISIKDSN